MGHLIEKGRFLDAAAIRPKQSLGVCKASLELANSPYPYTMGMITFPLLKIQFLSNVKITFRFRKRCSFMCHIREIFSFQFMDTLYVLLLWFFPGTVEYFPYEMLIDRKVSKYTMTLRMIINLCWISSLTTFLLLKVNIKHVLII